MEYIYNLIEGNIVVFVVVLVILWLILAIILIVNTVITKKLQNKYNFFMLDNKTEIGMSIEYLLTQYLEEVRKIEAEHVELKKSINAIDYRLTKCIQKIGVVRYNPFDNMGGNQCFAVAMLDDNNNGIVLNGIHHRDGSHTYAKPIEKGESPFALSDEEKESISIAKEKSNK